MSSFTIDAILGQRIQQQQRVPALPTESHMSAFLPFSAAAYLGLPPAAGVPHEAFLPFSVSPIMLEHYQRQQHQQLLLRAYQHRLAELEANKYDNHQDSKLSLSPEPNYKKESMCRGSISSPQSETESIGKYISTILAGDDERVTSDFTFFYSLVLMKHAHLPPFEVLAMSNSKQN